MHRAYDEPVKQNLGSRLMIGGICSSETQTPQCHIPKYCTAMTISNLCNATPTPHNTHKFHQNLMHSFNVHHTDNTSHPM